MPVTCLPTPNKKIAKIYADVSGEIAVFAFEYNSAIEGAAAEGPKLLPVPLGEIIFYPSRFMLKYNAVKRVGSLCSQFLVHAIACRHGLGHTDAVRQNLNLRGSFSACHEVGGFAALLFSLASSSLFLPAAYYAANYMRLAEFDWKVFSLFLGFGFFLMAIYNYTEYNRLRKGFKAEFFRLREKIRALP